jgi:hypothetical protein
MKKLLFASWFFASSCALHAQCTIPHISEFGAIDEPCHLGFWCPCDSCTFWWSRDGDPFIQGSERLTITVSGTHSYRVAAVNSCGGDTATCIADDRGCAWETTGIHDPDFGKKSSSEKTWFDMTGRIVTNPERSWYFVVEITRGKWSARKVFVW